jgi:hypothetical protein
MQQGYPHMLLVAAAVAATTSVTAAAAPMLTCDAVCLGYQTLSRDVQQVQYHHSTQKSRRPTNQGGTTSMNPTKKRGPGYSSGPRITSPERPDPVRPTRLDIGPPGRGFDPSPSRSGPSRGMSQSGTSPNSSSPAGTRAGTADQSGPAQYSLEQERRKLVCEGMNPAQSVRISCCRPPYLGDCGI